MMGTGVVYRFSLGHIDLHLAFVQVPPLLFFDGGTWLFFVVAIFVCFFVSERAAK